MRSTRALSILNIAKMGGMLAVLFVMFFAFPGATQAQSTCPEGTSMALGTCRCEQTLIGRGDSARTVLQCRATTSSGGSTGQPTTTVTSVLGAGGVTRQTTQVANTDGTVTQKDEVGEAAGGNILSCVSNPGMCFVEALKYSMGALVGGLAYVVLAIASFVLWIVGGLFNWVVIKTVFQFGSTFGTSEGMLIAWGILRDIGNIVLLFSFIFMGLATILNTHALDEYSARKALPRLIIFAVLLNFSLFAAQIVIDVSNSFASVFTAQAGDLGCTETAGSIDTQSTEDTCANNGIAGQVIQMAGVSSVWNATDIGEFMKTPAKHAPVFIGLAIFVTVTAVVLLAAAIMLIFRAVMLCLLMVLSPIGFAGMAIPPLQEFAHSWWSQLLKNAFFAPIYLLLVLISLKIVEGLIGPNNNGSFASAMIKGDTNAPQVFVIFAVVIAFMVAALTMARSMGGGMAEFATSKASALVFGAVTRGTNTIVGGGSRLARFGIQRYAPDSVKQNRIVKFAVKEGLQRAEKANLDIRRIPGMESALHHAVGDGAHEAHHASYADMSHQVHEFLDSGAAKEAAYQKDIEVEELKQEIAQLKKNPAGALSDKSQRLLARMSVDELAALHDVKHGIDQVTQALSPNQFEGLMKSDKVNASEKGHLAHSRFGNIQAALAGGYAQRDTVRDLSNKDLEMLAKYDAATFDQLLDVYDPATGDSMISGDQSESLGKSSDLTNAQRSRVSSTSKKGRIEAAVTAGNIAQAATFTATMSSKAKAKLNGGALTNGSATTGVMSTFTAGDLAEIQREGKLTVAQINAVRAAITDPSHPNHASIRRWIATNPNAAAYWG